MFYLRLRILDTTTSRLAGLTNGSMLLFAKRLVVLATVVPPPFHIRRGRATPSGANALVVHFHL